MATWKCRTCKNMVVSARPDEKALVPCMSVLSGRCDVYKEKEPSVSMFDFANGYLDVTLDKMFEERVKKALIENRPILNADLAHLYLSFNKATGLWSYVDRRTGSLFRVPLWYEHRVGWDYAKTIYYGKVSHKEPVTIHHGGAKGGSMSDSAVKDPRNRQAGGAHYKDLAIQPIEYCHRNHLGPMESNVVKYVTRHGAKGKAGDLKKAIHMLEMLLKEEYDESYDFKESIS